MKKQILFAVFGILFFSCGTAQENQDNVGEDFPRDEKIVKTETEWKAQLTREEFEILREKGTERPFTGDLLENKKEGVYICAGCDYPLFTSDTKFKSGTGWPSFFDEIGNNVGEAKDNSFGRTRTELICNRCDGHLGHVFNDGPQPTGLRYCINSASLNFQEQAEK